MLADRAWLPRLGYCGYGFNACGQICPSGAIPPLDLDRKRQAIIGVGVIDRNRLEEVAATDNRGEPTIVQRPYVLQDLCIGCGICEYQCPVEGKSAIQVYRV
jgi:NAD-dependent dihydropyrimidine dehydrogenase PreA subunit